MRRSKLILQPNLLELELFDSGLIRCDGCALNTDVVLLDGVRAVDGDLIVCLIAVFDAQIAVRMKVKKKWIKILI